MKNSTIKLRPIKHAKHKGIQLDFLSMLAPAMSSPKLVKAILRAGKKKGLDPVKLFNMALKVHPAHFGPPATRKDVFPL